MRRCFLFFFYTLFWLGFFLLFLRFFLFFLRLFCLLFLRRPLRIIDCGNYLSDFHFLALTHLGFEQASFFRDDLGGNFVGLEREESFAFVDELTGFLAPNGNDTTGDRFADRWNFNFDSHA